MERCLCIAMPLKVKEIITPRRTKIIVGSIFLSMIALIIPSYSVNHLAWVYNTHQNRTILSLAYSENRVSVESITFLIHSVIVPYLSLASVTIFTAILIVQLNKKQKWRQTTVAAVAISKTDSSSINKENKIVKMVTMIAILSIIFYTPASINFLITVYNPEFSFTGMYAKLYLVVWSFTGLLQTVNFSVNLFIYFIMSSKFRTTFLQIINKVH